ncbi:cupin domain-containing protein [Arthrobacter sp. ISL-30]|nr:cupin domain-containing protein [Arthrobacter sp. ISL-30]
MLPSFPGGTALTRLGVYDWEASDGLCGGSPHMHTASTEAYLVLAGTGQVETIRPAGHAVHDLAPGDLLWFSPGTIHRLINTDGLDLLVIMQNAGLPEAGDAVLTFPADIVGDRDNYARAALLPGPETGTINVGKAARARRDAAMAGYVRLKKAVLAGDASAVEEFHRDAVQLVKSRVPDWRALWSRTVAAEAVRTEEWLNALEEGDYCHLKRAAVARSRQAPVEGSFGMCGRLHTWEPGEMAG